MVWSSKKRNTKNPTTALLKVGTSRRYHHELWLRDMEMVEGMVIWL